MATIKDDTDLEIYQGDTVTKTFTFPDSYDLSGKTLTAVGKVRRGDTDNLFSTACSVTSQVATLTLANTITATLPKICDWELKDDANKTYLTGKIYTRRGI